jgi:hypothetical protein
MSDRRSRGTSWSSNCFQTSSAFAFLIFIFRSRKEFDSRQSNSSQGKRYFLCDLCAPASVGSVLSLCPNSGACRGGALQGLGTIRTRDVDSRVFSGQCRAVGRNAAQKEKGETAVDPQIYRELLYQIKYLCECYQETLCSLDVPGAALSPPHVMRLPRAVTFSDFFFALCGRRKKTLAKLCQFFAHWPATRALRPRPLTLLLSTG